MIFRVDIQSYTICMSSKSQMLTPVVRLVLLPWPPAGQIFAGVLLLKHGGDCNRFLDVCIHTKPSDKYFIHKT